MAERCSGARITVSAQERSPGYHFERDGQMDETTLGEEKQKCSDSSAKGRMEKRKPESVV